MPWVHGATTTNDTTISVAPIAIACKQLEWAWKSTSTRPSSCLFTDTIGTAHFLGSQNPGRCHLNFAEGSHLYIARTHRCCRIYLMLNNVGFHRDFNWLRTGCVVGPAPPTAPPRRQVECRPTGIRKALRREHRPWPSSPPRASSGCRSMAAHITPGRKRAVAAAVATPARGSSADPL